jgi:hypothetical protein
MAKNKKEMDKECSCGDGCDCGCNCGCNSWSKWHPHKTCGGIYGLGFLGAAVYYISSAATFGAGVLGFLKAIVWPAFLVYGLFKSLGM